ncbi:unnamed protein product [Orchesella dallaii]|uniref:Phosphatidylinositol N-acetylglucosaminyltransferase subunit Q n=1 Tax=Orchesella dallaii TaxID=48710 RepID=A0ABP1S7H0_9HEXA
MYFSKDFDNLGVCEELPVFHIFYPTTFAQVVTSFLNEKELDFCFVVGHKEPRVLKPGKGPVGAVPPPVVKSPLSVISEEGRGSRKSKRKSRSRRKQGGDNDEEATPGNTTTTTTSPPESSSPPYPPHSGTEEETAQKSSSSSSSKVDSTTANQRQTIAVNIIGVTESPLNFFLPEGDADTPLEIIGRCRSTKPSNVTHNSNLMLEFQLTETPHPHLSVEMVRWENHHFYPDPNHLLLFDYDPKDFQRWHIPDPLNYSLGLPKMFFEGISFLQSATTTTQSLGFTPAFPPIEQDHQNLNACNNVPSFITSSSLHSFISKKSAGLEQITHKVSILVEGLLGNYPFFPFLNFLILLLIDSFIGYCITSYLLQFPNLLGFLHEAVDQMLAHLNHLLKWLHGSPAGLKLNHNLNSLYWRFFSYHIHLWASYIGILEPVFAVILNTIQYLGGLGVTVQISLLKDLINLATFHVYCLYIYATRLYSIQTTTIASLFRVFFGRKYNPLRNRFDSVHLNTSELFISSFGFIILIFLFPTTMVYYAGFVFLRVPVLLIERSLQYFVSSFNKLPLVSWALVFLSSPRVADEIYLVPRLGNSLGIITFRLQLQSTRILFKLPDFGKGIKFLVSSVIDGTVLKD